MRSTSGNTYVNTEMSDTKKIVFFFSRETCCNISSDRNYILFILHVYRQDRIIFEILFRISNLKFAVRKMSTFHILEIFDRTR